MGARAALMQPRALRVCVEFGDIMKLSLMNRRQGDRHRGPVGEAVAECRLRGPDPGFGHFVVDGSVRGLASRPLLPVKPHRGQTSA